MNKLAVHFFAIFTIITPVNKRTKFIICMRKTAINFTAVLAKFAHYSATFVLSNKIIHIMERHHVWLVGVSMLSLVGWLVG